MIGMRMIAAIRVADTVGWRRAEGEEGRPRSRALPRRRINPSLAAPRGRAGSRTLKALLLAAVLLPPIGAAAVSPEDAYIATRDRFIASFKATGGAEDEKAMVARHDKALRDLERQLKPIVGPFSAPGFPAEGKLNLVSLFPDDEGFGMLDGIVYGEGESARSLVVTTDSLLDKWLLGHPKGRSQDELPISAAAAAKTADFYAQAVNWTPPQ